MNEKRRIKFTGKNLNDIFQLECVMSIEKIGGRPLVVCHVDKMTNNSPVVMRQGCELVEYDNGLWEIVRH